MSRIRRAYEERFRTLLAQAGARKLDKGVNWLVAEAEHTSDRDCISPADGLTKVYERLVKKPPFRPAPIHQTPPKFWCDAGLGGLARWLRAAGYEAEWRADIDDAELLREAQNKGAVALTTDSLLMERRLVRDRIIAALWLPPTLKIPEQLASVFREFNLRAGEPRCMACGGELVRTDKESLRERIPPKTYRWLDEYFICARCNKLFWRGTHWERISRELKAVR